MEVTVFHNIERDSNDRPSGLLDGYRPFHRVVRVYATTVPDTMDDLVACQLMFDLLNGDTAVDYRRRGNRSLCVGDLVRLDERRWYAVAPAGWTQLTNQPAIRHTSVLGSTELEEGV